MNERLYFQLLRRKCKKLSKQTKKHVTIDEVNCFEYHLNRNFCRNRIQHVQHGVQNVTYEPLEQGPDSINDQVQELIKTDQILNESQLLSDEEQQILNYGLKFNITQGEFNRADVAMCLRRCIKTAFVSCEHKGERMKFENEMMSLVWNKYMSMAPNSGSVKNLSKREHQTFCPLRKRRDN
ncbi:hypothetical protein GJ496_005744 [Pomphorhynchus laevis]|nr:hypothetical protein GJ496_005744 [Pomphorhynchus laevis]